MFKAQFKNVTFVGSGRIMSTARSELPYPDDVIPRPSFRPRFLDGMRDEIAIISKPSQNRFKERISSKLDIIC